MNFYKLAWLVVLLIGLSACTTGRLEYLNAQGEPKTACQTEYTWAPSIDKYAVEYILGYCARKAVEKGYTVLDKSLLALDLAIAKPPEGEVWTMELAKKHHRQGLLSDKEYGYIIAYLDLGHDKLKNN